MQHWEYRTVYALPHAVSWIKSEGWRVRGINEQEQPDWKKSEVYPSLAELCNQMGQQNWELMDVTHPDRSYFEILYFRRHVQWIMVEREHIQYWEYRTVFLLTFATNWFKKKEWRIKEINEQEQPDWKKSETYASVAGFCNQMSRQNWDLISVTYPDRSYFEIILYFKRPIQ